MLPKNYSKNGKNKSGGTETAGIMLIIISAFMLLCTLTGSLILGDIGLLIKNISIGLMGYFSYPLFLYCIIRGVFLLQNKKLAIKLSNLISLIVIFVCAGIIVHIATTASSMTNFGAYIDAVFRGATVGGVIFGLVAFFLTMTLTTVGAYILLACVMAVLLLLLSGILGKEHALFKSKKKKSSKNISGMPKGGTTYVGNGSELFIESIIPKTQNIATPGYYEDLPDETEKYIDKTTYAPGEDAFSPEIQLMRKQQDERFDEIYRRSRAHQILFENRSPDDIDGNSSYSKPSTPNARQDNPSPREERRTSNGWDDLIVMPPPKDVSSRFVSGSIINGESAGPVKRSDLHTENNNRSGYGYGTNGNENSRWDIYGNGDNSLDFEALKKSVYEETYSEYGEERRRYGADTSAKPDIEITRSEESGYAFDEPVQPYVPTQKPVRAPIINGDSMQDDEQQEVIKPTVTEDKKPQQRAPIIIGSTVMSDEPYVKNEIKPEQPEVKKNAPIIRASHYDEDVAAIQEAEHVVKSDELPEKTSAAVVLPEREENNVVWEEPVNNNTFVNALPESEPEEPVETESCDDVVASESSTADVDISENEVDDSIISDVETESNAELLISEDYESEYEIQPDEDELSNKDYMAIYGHPKFADITEQDAEELSSQFEKNTQSFNIVEEVEDASESAKYSTRDDSATTQKPSTEEKTLPTQKETKPKQKKPYKYTAPPIDLLITESTIPKINPEVYEEKKALLEETLENLGIPAKVLGITTGPTVTRYELNMPTGMSVKKIENCEQDIRYGLACRGKIRIESPIPGKKAVGIEVPNDENALVALKDIIESKEFNSSTSPLTVALGKDIQGKVMIAKIDKMPHLLIAGTTGSGKSACLNSLIVSLLYKSSPEDIKLILIDPKRVEFTSYSGLPHMMIPDAITESAQAINAFKWARDEMERRYIALQSNRVRNISEYNSLEDVKTRKQEKMPYIVIIVDEFADLMIASGSDKRKELENLISSIAGKARAAGIHLILATQRPSAEVITGTIKSNLPCRISFAVSNQTNSRIILDKVGAESLLGKGDMLYAPQENPDGIRIQGAFIETMEVNSIVEHIKECNDSEFNEEFEKALLEQKEEVETEIEMGSDNLNDDGYDKDLPDIVRMVIRTGQASGAMIQRKFSVGYMRAAKIIDQLETLNFIGPHNGSKPREVYVTKEKFKEFFGEEYDEY